jgi:hypothetical protein
MSIKLETYLSADGHYVLIPYISMAASHFSSGAGGGGGSKAVCKGGFCVSVSVFPVTDGGIER